MQVIRIAMCSFYGFALLERTQSSNQFPQFTASGPHLLIKGVAAVDIGQWRDAEKIGRDLEVQTVLPQHERAISSKPVHEQTQFEDYVVPWCVIVIRSAADFIIRRDNQEGEIDFLGLTEEVVVRYSTGSENTSCPYTDRHGGVFVLLFDFAGQ